MAITIPVAERQWIVSLMQDGVPQREIERITGRSRPYIRKLAREVGFDFPRNGFEVKGQPCMCVNCGFIFRRPPSKVERAERTFCSVTCKTAFLRGPSHPKWKTGDTAKSFSEWVTNQKEYKDWRAAVLERDGHRCSVSGKTENLEAHHIVPKAETMSPEQVFDLDNGITLCKEVHTKIHQLASKGVGFEDAIKQLTEEYSSGTDSSTE